MFLGFPLKVLVLVTVVIRIGMANDPFKNHHGPVGAVEALKNSQIPIDANSFNPDFTSEIQNVTVPVSRDATFRCSVNRLGGYRVGWVKADTKAIQAIHDHVITHNPRVSVTHRDHTTWSLHIKNVQEEDRGQYMCQINTDPMKSQTATLDVTVPPDFIFEETSGDVDVPEGGTVKLTCKAKGQPEPTIVWRRESGEDIVFRDHGGGLLKTPSFRGEILKLPKVSRSEIGAYLCIASNGVPPSVSKRILLNVNFNPVIQVPNQLVGAPLGTDVMLECYVEASPKAITFWMKDQDEMMVSSSKYDVDQIATSSFEIKMIAVVKNFQKEDVGTYRCMAKNSLGEVESNIRLYDIPDPNGKSSPYDDQDYVDQTGSAENEHERRRSPRIHERGRADKNTGTARHANIYKENRVPIEIMAVSRSERSAISILLIILLMIVYVIEMAVAI
ncbi:lachesin-like [Onthophagus taurus]|uniref:lachesin-like n=1 Tax=Onthophagus taurus TaxID=166361 RepID=UPI000C20CA6F|nr:lachesin-like [Onthophagus taurus]